MTWISYALNKSGTPISVHKCEYCGTRFTICPAHDEDAPDWGGCLGTTCISYDIKRDANRLFGTGKIQKRRIRGPYKGN